MFRKSNLPVLIALVVGAVGGWADASGKLDSLLKAEQKATATATDPTARPEGGCCANPDKALAAINAHNAKVSANLQKDGKKPNIRVMFGDDIGIPQISAYTQGLVTQTECFLAGGLPLA
jgi:hypothetical protein